MTNNFVIVQLFGSRIFITASGSSELWPIGVEVAGQRAKRAKLKLTTGIYSLQFYYFAPTLGQFSYTWFSFPCHRGETRRVEMR